VRPQNGSGKRQERHEHEQDEVEPDEHGVVAGDEPEGLVMRHPKPGDHHKAQAVGQVPRPELQQRFRQVRVARGGRDSDLKDQQGDGDGEDAIGQRQDAADTLFRRLVVLLPRQPPYPVWQLPHRVAPAGRFAGDIRSSWLDRHLQHPHPVVLQPDAVCGTVQTLLVAPWPAGTLACLPGHPDRDIRPLPAIRLQPMHE
jgi:hypothetical protein